MNFNINTDKESTFDTSSIKFKNLALWISELKRNNEASKLDLEDVSFFDETNTINPKTSNEDNFESFYSNFTNVILPTSKLDNFEAGIISNTSLEILSFFNENPSFTKKSIQRMFHDMYDNPQLLIGLLDGISSINYNLAKEELPIIATASLSHEDDEVVEYGIRCFENWRNTSSLKILRGLKCREEWMNIYVKKIVLELERELI